jgi:hypothetical protein
LRRRRTEPEPAVEPSGPRRRPRRPEPRDSKGKTREDLNDGGNPSVPLTEWPPSGMSSEEELTLGHAMELISRGVPLHKGHKRAVPHRSDNYYALFTTSAGNRGEETDAANAHDAMIQLMSLKIQGTGPAKYPWETLEQPSCAFLFGRLPGTITMNQWANIWSSIPPAIALRDPGIDLREVDLFQCFQRLKELEHGLEEDDPDYLYRNLYKRFLRDPDKILSPHKTLDKQLTDLIVALSKPVWIDFTNPKNQVVTRFIFDKDQAHQQQYVKFFHQLVLSMELDLRINSRQHGDSAKEKLSPQIPPTIQWNMSLARRWRENVYIADFGRTPEHSKPRLTLE